MERARGMLGTTVLTDRYRIERADAFLPLPGHGVIVVGVPAYMGLAALLLVADEGKRNQGGSATNSMESVIQRAAELWRREMNVQAAIIVHRDSAGSWEFVVAKWSQQHLILRVVWQRAKWPDTKPATAEAVLGALGIQATTAIEALRRLEVS
jgi:hypothetical protein